MSIHPVALIERLELLVCMTSMAMWFGMLLLIRAQEGESGWAWLWAVAFVVTSLLADLLFWRLV